MGNKGLTALLAGLQERTTIKKLNISSFEGSLKNKFTTEGVRNLKDLLNHPNCLLDSLQMDYVSLGNEGLKTAF